MLTRSVHRIAGIDFGTAADRLRLAEGDPQRSRYVFTSIDVSMRTTSAPWGISRALVFSRRPQSDVAALWRDRSGEDPVIHGRAGSPGNAAYKPMANGCRTRLDHSSPVVQGRAIQTPNVEMHTLIQGLEQAVPSGTGIATGGGRPIWLQPCYGLPALGDDHRPAAGGLLEDRRELPPGVGCGYETRHVTAQYRTAMDRRLERLERCPAVA
ncbi:hypothetical protein J2849_002679 [Azospirillum melinis]|nr:hypothetical protein [Azospirillum melinis]